MSGPNLTPPNRERAINAPLGALAVSLAILVSYAAQAWIGGDWAERFALVPQRVWNGELWRLVTVLFAHADWLHAFMNAVSALAFGAALARRLGETWAGRLSFIAYFLVVGVLTSVVEAGIDPRATLGGIGSSGAVFGLIGAMIRLVGAPDGAISPLHAPRVLTMAGLFAGITLLIAVLPGGHLIGWQAHLIGLGLGLFLIEYWPGVRGRPPEPAPAPTHDRYGGPWGS